MHCGSLPSLARLSCVAVRVRFMAMNTGGLGRLAIWHLPCGPVGPPARWAATLNVEVGGLCGHLTPLLIGPVCLVSQGRFEEPVRPWL